MKKSIVLILFLAIICTLSFAGCGEDTKNSTDSTISAKPTTTIDGISTPTNKVSSATPIPTLTPKPELIPSNIQVGEYIEFGVYEQDGDPKTKKEKIEWLVLAVEDNKALLISKYGLECIPYHKNDGCWRVDWKMDDIVIYKEPIHATHENVTYETSSLREWLTKDFYNKAFSNDEKRIILTTDLTANHGDVHDTVFVLNQSEAITYFSSDEERLCEATQHAKDQGAYIQDNNMCYWWLRAQEEARDLAPFIRATDGVIFDGTGTCIIDNTVRPALWVAVGQ